MTVSELAIVAAGGLHLSHLLAADVRRRLLEAVVLGERRLYLMHVE